MGVLTGKVVIVTGAGRGIGRGIAMGAAAEGARVVVADLGGGLNGGSPDSSVADAVVAEIRQAGGEAVAAADTVATLDGAKAIVGVALETWGRVDGVVCVAGILRHGPFLELTEADFDLTIATHLKGHFLMFQTAMKAMVEKGNGGSLIGISSGYIHGDAFRAPYRSAKAGIIALSKSAALAGVPHGVRANVIAPIANSRMTKASNLDFGSEPEDIAPMAVYLLSDRSADINGEVFSVMGNTVSTWMDPYERKTATHHSRWDQEQLHASVGVMRGGGIPGLKSAGPPPIGAAAQAKDGR